MDQTTALIVLGLVSPAGAKVGAQYFGMEQQEQALQLQAEQNQLAYQQKTLANYDLTNKILDRQLAQESVRGVGMGSPSFQAAQENVLSTSAKNQKNLDTEKSIFDRNAAIEKANVQMTFASQIFGDAADFASDLAGTASSFPSKA